MACNVVYIGRFGVNRGVVICVPYANEEKIPECVRAWTDSDKICFAEFERGVSDERGAELVWQAQPGHLFTKYIGAAIDMKK